MKKATDEPKKGAPAYMNTYGDMMTLLLTFFVLMFAMSSVDEAKFQAFVNAYSGAPGILDGGQIILNTEGVLGNGVQQFPTHPTMSAKDREAFEKNRELHGIQEELEEFIYNESLESKVGVEQKGDAIVLRFEDALLFDSGKAILKDEAKEVLTLVGGELSNYIHKGYKLKLEGHTDDRPIRTAQFPSNWELSAARAIAVARFYIEQMGFEPSAVSTEGCGEYMPIADNGTAEGRAINRRVEIKLTKEQ